MKISAIILNWNGKKLLEKCLKSVFNQNFKNFEVIVVDNGSTDGSIEMIENYDVNLIKLPYNMGVIEPRNIGMKNAKGKLLFVLDNDTEIRKDAFEKVVKKFENNPKLGIVSCSLVDKENVTSVWMHKFPKEKFDKKIFNTTIYSGGAHVIKKNILEETGYYPGDYFITAEEMDLSWRVLDRNYEIKYYPDVVVFHKQRSEEDISDKSKYFAMRNVYLVYWRLLPFETLIFRTVKKFAREFFRTNSFKAFLEAIKMFKLKDRNSIKRGTVNLMKDIEKMHKAYK